MKKAKPILIGIILVSISLGIFVCVKQNNNNDVQIRLTNSKKYTYGLQLAVAKIQGLLGGL